MIRRNPVCSEASQKRFDFLRGLLKCRFCCVTAAFHAEAQRGEIGGHRHFRCARDGQATKCFGLRREGKGDESKCKKMSEMHGRLRICAKP